MYKWQIAMILTDRQKKWFQEFFFIVIHLSFSAHSLVKPNNMIELAHIVWNDVTARY